MLLWVDVPDSRYMRDWVVTDGHFFFSDFMRNGRVSTLIVWRRCACCTQRQSDLPATTGPVYGIWEGFGDGLGLLGALEAMERSQGHELGQTKKVRRQTGTRTRKEQGQEGATAT